MSYIPETAAPARTRFRNWRWLLFVFVLHIFSCCLSLAFVAGLISYQSAPLFEKAHLPAAVLGIAGFALAAPLFAFCRFSFGYFLGFYFYTMIAGYVWLLAFTGFQYDHSLARSSILLSAVAFLAPAMLISSPIKPAFVLTVRNFDLSLYIIVALAAATVLAGSFYNFRLVSMADIYDFRDEVELPGPLRYAVGMMSGALLPFAFAGFVARGKPWLAGAALALIMLLYPVTLTKLTLLAPFWLLFLALLVRIFEARLSVMLSLLLPITLGIILVLLYKSGAISSATMFQYVGIVNVRMIALPSIALDVYNDFFSTHDLTYFCQISIVKPFAHCPYAQPLSVTLAQAYSLGNLNASLFATEGIASVGPWFAPLSALIGGLVIALGNRLSSGLSPKFIVLSGGVLPQIFLNVPLTTTLLTNGAGILFLLWYATPRSIFEPVSPPS
jgi:hypothetical protein